VNDENTKHPDTERDHLTAEDADILEFVADHFGFMPPLDDYLPTRLTRAREDMLIRRAIKMRSDGFSPTVTCTDWS